MTDFVAAKRKLSPSVIVAIVAVCVALAIGGVTIWQAAHAQSIALYTEDRKTLDGKIDKLTEAVNAMSVVVASIGQRLEDHIAGTHQ